MSKTFPHIQISVFTRALSNLVKMEWKWIFPPPIK